MSTAMNKFLAKKTPCNVSSRANTSYGATGRAIWNPLGTNYGALPDADADKQLNPSETEEEPESEITSGVSEK